MEGDYDGDLYLVIGDKGILDQILESDRVDVASGKGKVVVECGEGEGEEKGLDVGCGASEEVDVGCENGEGKREGEREDTGCRVDADPSAIFLTTPRSPLIRTSSPSSAQSSTSALPFTSFCPSSIPPYSSSPSIPLSAISHIDINFNFSFAISSSPPQKPLPQLIPDLAQDPYPSVWVEKSSVCTEFACRTLLLTCDPSRSHITDTHSDSRVNTPLPRPLPPHNPQNPPLPPHNPQGLPSRAVALLSSLPHTLSESDFSEVKVCVTNL